MRVNRLLAAVGVVVFAANSVALGQAHDASQVLAAARQALGGEPKLNAVRTFTFTGRTRQLRGNNLVPIEFEITCSLPDQFVRTDEYPAQDLAPTTLGFNGTTLIQAPAPVARGGSAPAGRDAMPLTRGGPAPLSPAEQRLVTVKQDFARWTLGLFAASFPSYPLTFRYAAEGEAPEGAVDVLDVSGPAGFAAQLVIQRATHLPVMLMWGQGPAETRLYYGDVREVDGLKWPFRVRRAIGGETVEETTVDRYRVNVKVDPRKFEAK